jgi:hypothetical protein
MAREPIINDAGAEVIALKALTFLASDADRIKHFMAVTGLAPAAIRAQAGKRAFLGGLLDYLRSDQTLLLIFAESEGLEPASIDAACFRLTGNPP